MVCRCMEDLSIRSSLYYVRDLVIYWGPSRGRWNAQRCDVAYTGQLSQIAVACLVIRYTEPPSVPLSCKCGAGDFCLFPESRPMMHPAPHPHHRDWLGTLVLPQLIPCIWTRLLPTGSI